MFSKTSLSGMKTSLTFCVWNVKGLSSKHSYKSKLEDPYLLNVVKATDIIAFVETQTSPDVPLSLNGYVTYRRDRPKSNNGRNFGGWAILIKEDLFHTRGISFMKQTDDFVWIKLCKNTFQFQEDIYLCILYIPPCNSKYVSRSNTDILENIQNDISNFSKSGKIILAGDFNARTGTELDFILNDADIDNAVDIEYISDIQIPLRRSLDCTLNARGKELIELCVSSKLRIVNGRQIGDTLGYHTCHKWNGSSVVDYVIVSEELLGQVSNFKINDHLSDISDHCCISFCVKAQYGVCNDKTKGNLLPLPNTFKWHNDSAYLYQQALASPIIMKEVESFMTSEFVSESNGIEKACEKLSSIIVSAAKMSLKCKSHKSKKNSLGRLGSHGILKL